MNHEQRVAIYQNQGPGYRPQANITPAQRRRIIKKARRDVLAWIEGKTPEGYAPSNDTFLIAGANRAPGFGFVPRKERKRVKI